tara:strand:+ start:36 stop:557 length:522 start_codon:yes stop_codon:yes gene_type:complete
MNINSDEYKNILLVSTWSQIYNVSLVFTLLSIFLIKILKKDDGNYSFHKLVLLLLLYLLQKFDIGNAEDYVNNLFIKRNFSNRYPEFKLLLDIYILSTKNSNEINVLCGKNKGSFSNICCTDIQHQKNQIQKAIKNEKYFISPNSRIIYESLKDEKELEKIKKKFEDCVNSKN